MVDSSFADYVTDDLLGHIDGITKKSMFGGWGIYKDGVIIAIIADDQLYMKVDDQNKPDYQEKESTPFVYTHKTRKPMEMSYWLLPEEIAEDKDALSEWVHRSYEASMRNKKKK